MPAAHLDFRAASLDIYANPGADLTWQIRIADAGITVGTVTCTVGTLTPTVDTSASTTGLLIADITLSDTQTAALRVGSHDWSFYNTVGEDTTCYLVGDVILVATGNSSNGLTALVTATTGTATVETLVSGSAATIAAHLIDPTGAHAASAVAFTPTGTIAATDTQAAVAEVATDAAAALTAHDADTTSVHGITDTSTLYRPGGTDVPIADGGTGASTAAAARTNLDVQRKTWIDPRDHGLATANPAAVNTAAMQAALNAVPAAGGVVYIPEGTYAKTGPLTVTVPGTIIMGAGRDVCTFTDTDWLQPLFDVFNVDDVTITDIGYSVPTSPHQTPGGAFRGDNPYAYSAIVWSNSSAGMFRQLKAVGTISGVHLSGWNGTALTGVKSDNTVEDLLAVQTDQGLLCTSQTKLRASRIDHRDAQMALPFDPFPSNPGHCIYLSSGGARHSDVIIDNCRSLNNQFGVGWSFRKVDGLQVSNLYANGNVNAFQVIDCSRATVSNVESINQANTGFSTIDEDSEYVELQNVILHDATTGSQSARLLGNYCHYKDIQIAVDSGTAPDGLYVVQAGGEGSTIDKMHIDNFGGDQTLRGVDVLNTASNLLLREITGRNLQYLGEVQAGASNVDIIAPVRPVFDWVYTNEVWRGDDYRIHNDAYIEEYTVGSTPDPTPTRVRLDTSRCSRVAVRLPEGATTGTIIRPAFTPTNARLTVEVWNDGTTTTPTLTWTWAAPDIVWLEGVAPPTPGPGRLLIVEIASTPAGGWTGRVLHKAGAIETQTFTASGTWTKPTWANTVTILMIAGAGGGGSGRRGLAGTVRCGGGGGAGGGATQVVVAAASLPATLAVVVGAGGTGGAAVAADDTNGNPGTAGISTTVIGTGFSARAGQLGSSFGSGGTATAGAAGVTVAALGSGNGGAASASGAAGGSGGAGGPGGAGGGAGGGITTGNAAAAGGAGAANYGTGAGGGAAGAVDASGTAGSAATSAPWGGGSGGGGGASITGPGGAGANGAVYGAGGGGGGASLNSNVSGAGGAGAPGIVVIISEG